MATIKHFLKKRGDESFAITPVCEADYLILASLSYADFEQSELFKEGCEGLINLSGYGKSYMIDKISKKYITLNNSYNLFLRQFFSSQRYQDVKIGYFSEFFNSEELIQFFAITYQIDDEYVICFRGTDNTLNGWKEDFNMSIMNKIPSHDKAKEYVLKMLKILKRKHITIIGHSKGGNIAYYSYFSLPKAKKQRIDKVYNFDGPGFLNDKFDYSEYGTKLFKFVPEDGIIGTLLDDSKNHEIIQSTKINLSGHDILTWVMDRKTGLTTMKRTAYHTPFSDAFRETINSWVYRHQNEYLPEMVEVVFKIVETNNIFTLGGLAKDLFFETDSYLAAVKDIDEEKKKNIRYLIKDLVVSYMKSFLKDRVEYPKLKKIHLFSWGKEEKADEQE